MVKVRRGLREQRRNFKDMESLLERDRKGVSESQVCLEEKVKRSQP